MATVNLCESGHIETSVGHLIVVGEEGVKLFDGESYALQTDREGDTNITGNVGHF